MPYSFAVRSVFSPSTVTVCPGRLISSPCIFIVSSFLGSGINGIYAMANKFPNIMNNFSSFFFTAFKENVAIAIKKDNYKKYYNEIYVTVHNAFIAISLLIISVLPFIFNIFIKNDYVAAYEYIPLLVIALYYGNMAGFYGTLFTAFKESKIIGKSTIVGAIINLIVHLSLIYFIGIYAAIISTLVSNYAVAKYRKFKLKDYVTLKPLKNYYLSIFILVLITGLYYQKNFCINILSLFISLSYVLIVNKELINDIKRVIIKRVHRKS